MGDGLTEEEEAGVDHLMGEATALSDDLLVAAEMLVAAATLILMRGLTPRIAIDALQMIVTAAQDGVREQTQ